MLLSFLLVCVIGIPILPPLFNGVVHHVSLPFRDKTTVAPRFKTVLLLEGLALTAVGWLLLVRVFLLCCTARSHPICPGRARWPVASSLS